VHLLKMRLRNSLDLKESEFEDLEKALQLLGT